MSTRSKAKRKARPGRERSAEGRVSLNLSVRPGDPARLRVIGNGNASAAVMRLLDEWEGRAVVWKMPCCPDNQS
jgi:hypothetical protein